MIILISDIITKNKQITNDKRNPIYNLHTKKQHIKRKYYIKYENHINDNIIHMIGYNH